MKPQFAICVAGWHFNEPFYRQVRALGGNVFVIAHRPWRSIPDYVPGLLGRERVFCAPNLGYDWGCYQQFLRRGIWRDYEGVVFMHDDVAFRNLGIMSALREKLRIHAVVGNGPTNDRQIAVVTRPESYAHARWKPPPMFVHQAVRGSFFAATTAALKALGTFEVHWDPWRLTAGVGNWSTRASCARWQHLLGSTCFGYLSETYCESAYLSELERGGAGENGKRIVGAIKPALVDYVRKVSRETMDHFWGRDSTHYRIRPLVLKRLSALVWVFSLAPGAWVWEGCAWPAPSTQGCRP